MSRILPHPVLFVVLTLVWLMLTRFSLGHLVLGAAVALVASQGMAALMPARPRFRRWDLIPRLCAIVAWDILRSNLAVAWAIVSRHPRVPGFVEIPLELQDRNALALLAIIITATPGTAWVEYRAKTGTLVLHAFDMVEEGHWRDLIKNRYQSLLMEIFE